MSASAIVVPVTEFTSNESGAWSVGTTRLTISWATRATTESPRHAKRNFQRSLGITEASHRGRRLCRTRTSPQAHRIIAPSVRLR
jgi:hypothetical protein